MHLTGKDGKPAFDEVEEGIPKEIIQSLATMTTFWGWLSKKSTKVRGFQFRRLKLNTLTFKVILNHFLFHHILKRLNTGESQRLLFLRFQDGSAQHSISSLKGIWSILRKIRCIFVCTNLLIYKASVDSYTKWTIRLWFRSLSPLNRWGYSWIPGCFFRGVHIFPQSDKEIRGSHSTHGFERMALTACWPFSRLRNRAFLRFPSY